MLDSLSTTSHLRVRFMHLRLKGSAYDVLSIRTAPASNSPPFAVRSHRNQARLPRKFHVGMQSGKPSWVHSTSPPGEQSAEVSLVYPAEARWPLTQCCQASQSPRRQREAQGRCPPESASEQAAMKKDTPQLPPVAGTARPPVVPCPAPAPAANRPRQASTTQRSTLPATPSLPPLWPVRRDPAWMPALTTLTLAAA